MFTAQVHYEVFARSKINAPWSLQFATEDRQRALQGAEEMLAEGVVAAVKVYKEILDQHTRAFQSVNIFSKGAVEATVKRRPASDPDTPVCVTPQDLYSGHAREKIGRLLDAWLRRRSVTAFEMLHRPDLVGDLDASGVELQHAIQKIAIPEAQARGLSTHEVIRTFQKLVERAVDRVLRDGKSKIFPTITTASFAQVVTKIADEDVERVYVLGGGVAAYLASTSSWSAKVSQLLDLADAAPPVGRARSIALSVLEQPLSEILSSHGGIGDLVGLDLDLGGCLAALTRLAAPEAVKMVVAYDPGLERCLPPLAPEVDRLAEWLQHDAFEMVRAGLGRRILHELKGPRRLRPSDPDGEIAVLRALAMALTAATGQLMSPEDVQEAFIERSKSLVAGDFVSTFLDDRESALSEVQALVRLAENVAGPLNKRAAGRYIAAAVGALRFEKESRLGTDTPAGRLASLAALQRNVLRTGLADADAEEITAMIGQVGGWVESDSRLVHLIARSSAPVVQRLTLLLRVGSGEAAPRGPAADRGKAEALKLLRSAATRAEVAKAPAVLERVKDLIGQAGLAAPSAPAP